MTKVRNKRESGFQRKLDEALVRQKAVPFANDKQRFGTNQHDNEHVNSSRHDDTACTLFSVSSEEICTR